ncbi:phosphatase 2C-like domain-containing protein [Chaetomium sp. MPI-CAGE-AT-0009]|nr:phosphatase 2C-like domain-containing protein [Chaetomium sp. MPI-CAGE-AT-0009]
MRRAAIQAFRASLQCSVRGFRSNTRRDISPLLLSNAHRRSIAAAASTRRLLSTSPPSRNNRPRAAENAPVAGEPLRSSMYFRRASVALVSALVGYGAYYSYGTNGTDSLVNRSYSSSSTPTATGDAATQTRSVLVIGADELHTGTFVGDGPISKTTGNDGKRVIEMVTPEQATEMLRKSELSYYVDRGQGVVRYDLVQLPSNDPIEDDHAEKIVEMPDSSEPHGSSDWMFWGVFDGHSGWTTSAKLRQALTTVVARELNDTYRASSLAPPPEAIDAAIKKGFLKLDDDIVNKSVQKVLQANNKTAAAELLAPALSGSCALLSFYDSRSKLLRVACTGDSRAVLGRRSASGKWTATPLSVDQTGSNPDEAARLQKLHPNEPQVVRNGRVLGGLEPTRAFGDASYKWTREISEKLRQQFFARSVSSFLKTPPYVTAEPVITTTKIEPEKGDFVVMATDGLWEMLTNEEVVGLVGKWIETQQITTKSNPTSQFDSVWKRIFGSRGTKDGLPVEVAQDAGAGGQKTPFRRQQWGDSADGFVVQDSNVATHLVRNALGGKNQEQVSALLTLPAPFSRRYRDDLTVQVIFFGNGERTGEVVLNRDATAAANKPVKAKL